MNVTVTKFIPEQAGVYQNGNLRAFDLVPEGEPSELVFHWVQVAPGAVTEPEENDVAKTFLMFDGGCTIEMDGIQTMVQKGEAVWLPKGSVHVIRNGDTELKFIVVKPK